MYWRVAWNFVLNQFFCGVIFDKSDYVAINVPYYLYLHGSKNHKSSESYCPPKFLAMKYLYPLMQDTCLTLGFDAFKCDIALQALNKMHFIKNL